MDNRCETDLCLWTGIVSTHTSIWFTRDAKAGLFAISGVDIPSPRIVSCDLATGRRQWRVNLEEPTPAPVHVLDVASHDGQRVAVLTLNHGRVYANVWNGPSERKLCDLPTIPELPPGGERRNESSLAALPDGKTVAVTFWNLDGTFGGYIANMDTGAVIRKLEPQSRTVESAESVVSPDGSTLVVTGYELAFWDLKTGKPHYANGHSGAVDGIWIAPDQKRAISTAADHMLRCWSLDDGREFWFRSVEPGVKPVQFSEDGTAVFLSNRTRVSLDNGTSKSLPRTLGADDQGHLTWTSMKNRLAITVRTLPMPAVQKGASDRLTCEIRLFDWPEGKFQKSIPVDPVVSEAVLSDDGKRIHALVAMHTPTGAERFPTKMRVTEFAWFRTAYDIESGTRTNSTRQKSNGPMYCINGRWCIRSDGSRSASYLREVTYFNETNLVDVETGQTLFRLKPLKELESKLNREILASSPAGDVLAMPETPRNYTDPLRIHLFHARDGSYLRTVATDLTNYHVRRIAVTNGGQRVVTSDHSNVVKVWDAIVTGKP